MYGTRTRVCTRGASMGAPAPRTTSAGGLIAIRIARPADQLEEERREEDGDGDDGGRAEEQERHHPGLEDVPSRIVGRPDDADVPPAHPEQHEQAQESEDAGAEQRVEVDAVGRAVLEDRALPR